MSNVQPLFQALYVCMYVCIHMYVCTSKYKKLLISKRRIGILKKLPKQGEDSKSL